MRSKKVKIIVIFISFIILGLFSLSILIKTSYVQQKIIGLIKSSISKSAGQQLKIEKVDFNIISGIVFSNIELNIDNEKFVVVDIIKVAYPYSFYKIIKQIAAKDINIEDLEIIGLKVKLSKNKEGDWNYQNLKKTKDEGHDKQSENANYSNWKVSIGNFGILQSQISVESNPENTPKIIKIEQFRSLVIINTSPLSVEVKIKSGQFNVEPDGLNINNLASSVLKLSKKETVIGDLHFDVNGSKVSLSGELIDSDEKQFSINSTIDNFVYKQLNLNMDLKGNGKYSSLKDIAGQFNLDIHKSEYLGNEFSLLANDIKIENSVLKINNALLDGEIGKANISLDSDLKKIFDKEVNNEFRLNLELADFDFSKISELYSRVSDENYDNIDIAVNADFRSTGFFNTKNDFNVKSKIDKLSIQGDAGNADLQGVINVSDKLIETEIKGELNDLNLGYILASDLYKSSINSTIDINTIFPIKFDLKQVSGSTNIKILKSRLFNKEVSSGLVSAKFSPNKIERASVKLLSDFLNFDLSGKTNNGKLDFIYNLKSSNLAFVSDFKKCIELEGAIDLNGKIRGELLNPTIDYSLDISGLGFGDLKAASGKSKGSLSFDKGVSGIDSSGKFEKLNFKDREFESLDFKVLNQDADLFFELLVKENDLNSYELALNLPDFKNEKKIEFTKIRLNFADTNFKNTDAFYVNYSDGISIDGFNLSSGDSSIKGSINFAESKSLSGKVDFINFELLKISGLLDFKDSISGILNGNINISGKEANPKLESALRVDDLIYKEFISKQITFNSSYENKKFNVNLASDLEDDNDLNLSGVVDSDLRFSGIKPSFDISRFDLTLLSNNLNLSPFSKFIGELEDINGAVDLDLKIKGTPDSPRIFGNILLEHTNIKLKQLKNEIRIDKGDIAFDGDNAKFDNFLLKSGDGKADISGNLNFTEFTYTVLGEFEEFRINPRRINTNLTGNLELTGKAENLFAKGDIKLNRTRINISQSKKQEVSEIKFVDQQEDEKGEIVIKNGEKENYFKDNVALDLDISIPKNSWVRGRGANVELKGALKIDKEYEDEPLITGNISAVRGTYKIFGKLFKIQEGNVSFPGVKEINPLLDITALYNVSDVDIFVNLGGDVKNPKIKLSSDPSLEETDIISYLIFGSSSNNLGTGERSSLSQVATGLAGGVALNQLKGVLGDDVSPDVLSFGTGTAGPELEVGKYLNDDLYIAYERKSSSDSSSSIPTDTVKVEYRLFDYLSVGSDVGSEQSGGDLFLNFDF